MNATDFVQLLKMNLMAKSKSKTFPKGTEAHEISEWVDDNIAVGMYRENYNVFGEPVYSERTTSKYLIQITKLPDKDGRRTDSN